MRQKCEGINAVQIEYDFNVTVMTFDPHIEWCKLTLKLPLIHQPWVLLIVCYTRFGTTCTYYTHKGHDIQVFLWSLEMGCRRLGAAMFTTRYIL